MIEPNGKVTEVDSKELKEINQENDGDNLRLKELFRMIKIGK